MRKKNIFVPGWMYSPKYFKLGEGLNIWEENIDFNQSIDCDYLIGHSMGAAIALHLWSLDKNKKLILINPFIDQKSVLQTFGKWLKFMWHEGAASEGLLGLKYLPRNIKKLFKFPEENYWEILKDIPKNKITILHGAEDLFLCGNAVCADFRKLGFEVIEVPEAGHDWHKNFDNAIMEIINR